MDHTKVFMLLEAHSRLLGLPQFKNLRAAIEAELAKIDASLDSSAPKVVPAPAADSEIDRRI